MQVIKHVYTYLFFVQMKQEIKTFYRKEDVEIIFEETSRDSI